MAGCINTKPRRTNGAQAERMGKYLCNIDGVNWYEDFIVLQLNIQVESIVLVTEQKLQRLQFFNLYINIVPKV